MAHSTDAHLFINKKLMESVLLTNSGVSGGDGVAKSSTYGGHSLSHVTNIQKKKKLGKGAKSFSQRCIQAGF